MAGKKDASGEVRLCLRWHGGTAGMIAKRFAFRFWVRPSTITLADRERDVGRFDRAGRLYRRALRRNPKNAEIWVQYGHIMKALGDLDRAEAAYRQAIDQAPTNSDAQLQLAHVLKLLGREKAAQAAYLRVLALDAGAEDALTELGRLGWSESTLSELRKAALSSARESVERMSSGSR
jgi:tetratricopeptide (TPR) repeat protein